MTTSLSQTVLMNDLTPVKLVALNDVSGTYYNGPNNNGVGATLTISATSLTVDGTLAAVGDRILLQNQAISYQNGIYICKSIGSTVVLQRAADSQNVEQLKAGQFVFVGGGLNAGAVFVLCSPLPQVIGTDAFIYNTSSTLKAQATISAAEFNGMYAAPKLILPAPGANNFISLNQVSLIMTYGSVQFAGGGIVAFQYDNTVNGAGVKASNTQEASDFTVENANAIYQFISTSGNNTEGALTAIVNKAIYLSNQTGAFTTGNSSFVAKLNYRVISTL